MQIWAESGKSALPICNYSQILYQFLTFTQNLKRSQVCYLFAFTMYIGSEIRNLTQKSKIFRKCFNAYLRMF